MIKKIKIEENIIQIENELNKLLDKVWFNVKLIGYMEIDDISIENEIENLREGINKELLKIEFMFHELIAIFNKMKYTCNPDVRKRLKNIFDMISRINHLEQDELHKALVGKCTNFSFKYRSY